MALDLQRLLDEPELTKSSDFDLSGVDRDPDAYAKTVKIADQAGMPSYLVEGNEKNTEIDLKKRQAQDWYALEQDSPALFTALKNNRFQSQAHDDIPQLSSMEKLFFHGRQLKKDVSKPFENITETIPLGFQNVFAGLETAAIESIDLDLPDYNKYLFSEQTFNRMSNKQEEIKQVKTSKASSLIEDIYRRNETIDDLTPDDMSVIQEGFRGFMESSPYLVTAMAAGVATGGVGALTSIGAATFGKSYGDGRSKGLSPNESLLYAGVQSTIEVGTEMIPIGTLMDLYRRNTSVSQGVMRFIKQEMFTEQLATIGQSMTDYVAGLDEELENAPLSEWPEIQGRRQLVTGVATFFTGGTQVGVVSSISKAIDSTLTEEQRMEQKSRQDQQHIDNVVAAAESSKLRGRNVEEYKTFVENAAKDQVVFIDGPQAVLYIKGKDIEGDPVLTTLSEQVNEADATNGEVMVSVADFASDIVGSEHFEALRPHMTMDQDSLSPFRQENEKVDRENYVKSLLQKANENVDELNESNVIFDEVVAGLVDSGQISKKNARLMAQIVPAWVAVKSKELGVPAEELYADVGLTIEGPFEDRKAVINDENVLEQSIEDFASLVKDDLSLKDFHVFESRDRINLNSLIIDKTEQKKGKGTEAMNRLIQYADDAGKTIVLEPGLPNDSHGTTSRSRLVKFYKRFGFIESKGRNLDYEIGAGKMYRVTKNDVYNQSSRGYYDPNKVLIRLTEASDSSTFMHEFAHFMYDMEQRYEGNNTESIKDWFRINSVDVVNEANGYLQREIDKGDRTDHTTELLKVSVAGGVTEQDLQDFLNGSLKNQIKIDQLNRATHEQFARGFELYLMEGKAPSLELRNMFRELARMIVAVYKNIQNSFNAPQVDDEMRRTFDRLIATEDQIKQAEYANRYTPLFTSAVMAGMSEKKYQEYLERQLKANDKATETLREKLLKELTRYHTKEWNRELAEVKEIKKEEISQQQVYITREKLKTDEYKLNRGLVKETLGLTKTPRKLNGMTTQKEGNNPEDIAPIFGYESGLEMLNDVMNAVSLDEASSEAAQSEMLARHGDILNDGTLDQVAEDEARNEERGKALLREVKILSKSTRVPAIDAKTIKVIAKQSIGKLKYSEIRPDRYRKAEIKSAQQAITAMNNNDKDAALRAKTQQVMNFHLWREAKDARGLTDKILTYTKRLNTKKVQQSLGKAGNEYLEQVQSILQRFEFRKSVSERIHKKTLSEWLADRAVNMDNIHLSPEVIDENFAKHWRDVPHDELIGVYESLKSIEHNSKSVNDILIAEQKHSFNQAKKLMLESMSKVDDKFHSERTDIVDPTHDDMFTGGQKQRSFLADNTKVPWLMSWLDGGDRVGIMHDTIMQPMTDALHDEMGLLKEVSDPIVKAFESRSEADKLRHDKDIFIPEIKNDATEHVVSNNGILKGHQVLAVALNIGTESNLRKLLLGEGWATEDSDVSVDNLRLQAVLSHMTETDWSMVELVWSQINSMYPRLTEVHEKSTGLPLKKVDGVEFITSSGRRVQGMYYPMHYDPLRSLKAKGIAEKTNEEILSLMSSTGSMMPSATTGSRIERTNYVGPIALTLDVVPNHIQEIAHFISHYEAVRQSNKFITDPEIASAIVAKMGHEEYDILKPWLNNIAKNGRTAETKKWGDNIADRLRFGTTLGIMGFKASTMMIQVAGLFNTMGEVGVMPVLHSQTKLGTGPIYRAIRTIFNSEQNTNEHVTYAIDKSKVLSHRLKTYDREVSNAAKNIKKKKGSKFRKIQELSMYPIGAIQFYVVDLPSWYAGYEKGMSEYEGDEARSVKYADWVVEQVQGSGAIKDMSLLMADKNPYMRLFTMFMTFFSSAFNANRDVVRQVKSGQLSIVDAVGKFTLMWLLPAIFEELVRNGLSDEDDEEASYEKILLNTALTPLAGNPFTRVTTSIFNEFRANTSPVLTNIERGFDGINTSNVKAVSKLVGAYYGVPGVNQVWLSAEHLSDFILEGEELTIRELAYGPQR